MERLFKFKPKIREPKKFNYKIKEQDGKFYKGSMEAYDRNSAVRKLFKPGEKIIYCRQEVTISFGKKTKIKKSDLVDYFDNLAFLMGAGLTLADALDIARENTEHLGLKKAIGKIYEQVLTGVNFSTAMEDVKAIPKGTYIYQLRAGEKSGELDKTLVKLSEQLARDGDFKSAIIGALTYPIMMVVALVGVVIFMLVFLIPVLASVFMDMGAELPEITLMLVAASEFVIEHKFIMLAIAILTPSIPIFLYKKTKARKYMDIMFIRMPLIKFFIKEIAFITFTNTLAMLLETGITTTDAVEITIDTMSNYRMRETVTEVRDIIRDKGRTLGQAMEDTQEFPPKLIKLSEVGVKSGKLSEILHKTSVQMEKEFRVKVNALVKSIEPILMMVIAAVLGFIMLAMYLPMFTLMEQI